MTRSWGAAPIGRRLCRMLPIALGRAPSRDRVRPILLQVVRSRFRSRFTVGSPEILELRHISTEAPCTAKAVSAAVFLFATSASRF
jgi:hypothetical protein